MLGGGGGLDDDDGDYKTDDSDLDEPGWRITSEMMDRVDLSDWLRSELGDGGLIRRHPHDLCLQRRRTSGKQSGAKCGAAL